MTQIEGFYPQTTSMRGNLPVTSRYTFGIAGERFFRSIKDEGRILGTYCRNCDHLYVPPAIFCERCLSALDEWEDMGTCGEVHTFTVLYEDEHGAPQEEARVVVFVCFGDGGLVHYLHGVDPENVEIGMIVEAEFKPKSERTGSIMDILHFKPVTD
jgi:uncharacterized OB-fold protein